MSCRRTTASARGRRPAGAGVPARLRTTSRAAPARLELYAAQPPSVVHEVVRLPVDEEGREIEAPSPRRAARRGGTAATRAAAAACRRGTRSPRPNEASSLREGPAVEGPPSLGLWRIAAYPDVFQEPLLASPIPMSRGYLATRACTSRARRSASMGATWPSSPSRDTFRYCTTLWYTSCLTQAGGVIMLASLAGPMPRLRTAAAST